MKLCKDGGNTITWFGVMTNFCTGVMVHDVITSANFYNSRVRGFGVVGGQILGFSIDLKLLIYLRIRVVIASNLLNLVAAAMSENTF